MVKKKKSQKRKIVRREKSMSIKSISFEVNRLFAKGQQYHREGQLSKADKVYTKILKAHPDLSDCLHLKGFVAHQLGNNEIAIEFITKAIQKKPDDPVFYYNLSLPLLAQNKLNEAITCLENAIQLNPDMIQAHINLGNILQEQKRYSEAISFYNKALKLNSNDPLVHMNMGNILQSQGKYSEAISIYEKALSLRPSFAEVHYNKGISYKNQGNIEQAISCYRKAVELNPEDFNAYYNMGIACQDLNKLDEAKDCFRTAIEIRTEGVEAYIALGNVIANQGNFKEAISWYTKALKLRPNYGEAFYSIARAMKVTKNESAQIFETANRLKETELTTDSNIYMNFALGKIYDDLGMYEEAFKHYQKGNEQERSKHIFHAEEHHVFISKIIQSFNIDFFSRSQDWSNTSKKPIFIFGMPRSGTSLVEQIISSHPKVFGAGEISFFLQFEKTLAFEKVPFTYPEYMEWFDWQTASVVANSYLKLIENLSGQDGRYLHVTDKMPNNFLYLGLLYAIFPNARFIHCQRNPLDNCLSLFFQKFTGSHLYSYNLEELGRYYVEYRRLMAHWDEVLPNVVYHVRYEDLVSRQEDLSRQIIAFCGLDWDTKCLYFHKNDRPVFTSSNWQVRQSIYKSSVERWKNYEKFLNPLKKILGALV